MQGHWFDEVDTLFNNIQGEAAELCTLSLQNLVVMASTGVCIALRTHHLAILLQLLKLEHDFNQEAMAAQVLSYLVLDGVHAEKEIILALLGFVCTASEVSVRSTEGEAGILLAASCCAQYASASEALRISGLLLSLLERGLAALVALSEHCRAELTLAPPEEAAYIRRTHARRLKRESAGIINVLKAYHTIVLRTTAQPHAARSSSRELVTEFLFATLEPHNLRRLAMAGDECARELYEIIAQLQCWPPEEPLAQQVSSPELVLAILRLRCPRQSLVAQLATECCAQQARVAGDHIAAETARDILTAIRGRYGPAAAGAVADRLSAALGLEC